MIRTLKFSVQTMYNHFQQWKVKSTTSIFYNICSVGRMFTYDTPQEQCRGTKIYAIE